MDLRPLDLVEMGTSDYDITAYQPVLYCAQSVDEVVAEIGGFFRSCDDASIGALRAVAGRSPDDRDSTPDVSSRPPPKSSCSPTTKRSAPCADLGRARRWSWPSTAPSAGARSAVVGCGRIQRPATRSGMPSASLAP